MLEDIVTVCVAVCCIVCILSMTIMMSVIAWQFLGHIMS